MKRTDVMFVIDNPYRELWGVSAVIESLRRRGVRSVLCSKADYWFCYDCLKPRTVVLPRIRDDMADFARFVYKKAHVCLIPVEHSSGIREKAVKILDLNDLRGKIGADTPSGYIAKIFLPGMNHYNWLREEGTFREGQMCVSGTLNSDHWFLSGRARDVRRPFRVGIATTNKSMLFTLPQPSVMKNIDIHCRGGWEKNLWRVDIAARDMANMLLVTDIVEWLRGMDVEVSIRPHPHENLANWKRFARGRAEVRIDRSLTIDEWLSGISLMIGTFTTASIDCIAHGIPCISLEKMIPGRFVNAHSPDSEPFRNPYSWNPGSRDELLSLVRRAREGRLDASPDPESTKRFMKDNFSFPRGDLACNLIADQLVSICRSEPGSAKPLDKGEGHRTVQHRYARKPYIGFVMRRVPFGSYISWVLINIYTYISSPRRENLYFSFDIARFRDARRYVKRLFACRDGLNHDVNYGTKEALIQ